MASTKPPAGDGKKGHKRGLINSRRQHERVSHFSLEEHLQLRIRETLGQQKSRRQLVSQYLDPLFHPPLARIGKRASPPGNEAQHLHTGRGIIVCFDHSLGRGSRVKKQQCTLWVFLALSYSHVCYW